jgi:hypothetical protein
MEKRESEAEMGRIEEHVIEGKPSVSQALFLPGNQCFLFRTFFDFLAELSLLFGAQRWWVQCRGSWGALVWLWGRDRLDLFFC